MNLRREQIKIEILTYLAGRPEAQDTVEGIAEWWLLEHFVDSRVAEVRSALSDLVGVDLVVEKRGGDAWVRYQVNAERLPEIKALLAGNPG